MLLKKSSQKVFTALSITFVILISACSMFDQSKVEHKYPEQVRGQYTTDVTPEQKEGIFGEGGLTLFGGKRDKEESSAGIGVNSFLWRACLDTLAFMPLNSADAFGGVIITEWYSPPETPNERFKVNAFILSKTLRADGIKVTTFRQIRNDKGEWVDSSVNPNTATELEDAILTRARQLRIAHIAP